MEITNFDWQSVLSIFNYVWIAVLFCTIPAGVLWLCRKYPIFDKIGPVMILYAIGVVIGNIPMPEAEIAKIQDIIPQVMVPLAIPMMLFGCTFKTSEIGLQLRLVLSGIVSVAIAVTAGYLITGHLLPDGANIGGMIAGKCTGGTLNAVAVKAMLGISDETYIILTTYDIIICFVYFVFLLGGGIRLFRWLYGESRKRTISADDQAEIQREIAAAKANPYKGLWSKAGLTQIGKVLATTLAVVAVAAGVGMLAPKGWFMVLFILSLTTLGILLSFVKPIQKFDRSYDLGMYLIYIFSLAIASMADLSNLNIMENLELIGFLVIAIFASLFIHALFCRLMKVDADSMVISSVAFINSPPFVPMISAAMKNRATLVTGISAGLIGYAIGNYFGFLMSELLSKL